MRGYVCVCACISVCLCKCVCAWVCTHVMWVCQSCLYTCCLHCAFGERSPESEICNSHVLGTLFLWKCLDFEGYFPKMNRKFSNYSYLIPKIHLLLRTLVYLREHVAEGWASSGHSSLVSPEAGRGRPWALHDPPASWVQPIQGSDQHLSCLRRGWGRTSHWTYTDIWRTDGPLLVHIHSHC